MRRKISRERAVELRKRARLRRAGVRWGRPCGEEWRRTRRGRKATKGLPARLRRSCAARLAADAARPPKSAICLGFDSARRFYEGSPTLPRTGGQILVDQLVAQGVERVYCVPGESYLAALDALYDSPIEVTVCRQEAGAAIMALTDGRLTGRPGVCFVTRGPGATNAAHGVHIAEHDSAPMILFVGQVERAMLGRGAFQEMDYRALFGSTAKWATEIENARPDPRNRPARLPRRHAGPARSGRDRAARGRADRDARRSPTRRAPRRRRSGRA